MHIIFSAAGWAAFLIPNNSFIGAMLYTSRFTIAFAAQVTFQYPRPFPGNLRVAEGTDQNTGIAADATAVIHIDPTIFISLHGATDTGIYAGSILTMTADIKIGQSLPID